MPNGPEAFPTRSARNDVDAADGIGTPRRAWPRALTVAALVAASLALNLAGIRFGQPRHWDASVDSIHPVFSLDAVAHLSAERSLESVKYPRLHYVVTGLVQRAWLMAAYGVGDAARIKRELLAALDRSAGLENEALRESFRPWREPIGGMIVAGRVVSAVMGAMLVLAVHLFANALLGFAAGAVAAAFTAVNYPFVYYAHLLNVDVPYLCLGAFALHAIVRAAQTGRARWFAQVAVFSAAAVATKDQAYGMLLLPMVAALVLLARRAGGFAALFGFGGGGRGRALVVAALLGVVVYALALGLPFDVASVRAHFEHVFGAGVDPFREHDASLAGQWALLGMIGAHLGDALGPVVAVLAVMGCVVLARRAGAALVLVAAPALSTWLTFIAPIGYCYLRFVLPIVLCAFVAAAVPVAWMLTRRGPWNSAAGVVRLAGAALLAACTVPMAAQSIALDRMLRADPRVAAQRWLDEQITPGARVVLFRDLQNHNVEVPRQAQVAVLSLAEPKLPPSFGTPEYVVIALHDPVRSAYEAMNPPLPHLPERRMFGNDYVLIETFAPAFEHPIRRGAAFQPTVLVYALARTAGGGGEEGR